MISQSKQKGFTIVELLIVIVVIGILAAISIVAYNNVTQKARDDQRVTDARNIVNAAASYQAEIGTWPSAGQLTGYNTVSLSGSAKTRLEHASATGATNPTDGTKDTFYRYVACPASGTQTGVRVVYWKEDGSSAQQLTAGTGCPTTP